MPTTVRTWRRPSPTRSACATTSWASSISRPGTRPSGSSARTSSTPSTRPATCARPSGRWPRASGRRWPPSSMCSASSTASIRPASAPGISPNAWRCSSRSRTASTPPCRRWSRASTSWPGATCRPCAACAGRRRGPARHAGGDPPPGAEARPRLRGRARPGAGPGRGWCALPDGEWHVELNPETLPRVLVNQTYYARVSKAARGRAREGLRLRVLAECPLARPLPRPARQDGPQGRDRDRAPAGRVLPPRGRAPEAPEPQDRGGRDRMHESTVSRVTSNKAVARAAAPSR
jgi:hypothetical protein